MRPDTPTAATRASSTRATPTHASEIITVASFNCLHGIDLRAGRPDPARPTSLRAVADALAGLGADVIALQEVDRGLARSAAADQIGQLAAALGMHGVFGPALLGDPDRSWVPAPPADPGGGAYGVGVLSRFPIRRSARLRLPGGGAGERAGAGGRPLAMATQGDGSAANAPVPDGGRRRATGSSGDRDVDAPPAEPGRGETEPGRGEAEPGRGDMNPGWDREPRVALRVEIAHPAATVAVTTTHLSYLPWRSLRQLRTAARFAGERPRGAAPSLPSVRVLTGDFNLPGRVAGALLPGWYRCASAPTYPADDPRLQVDQILVQGDATVVASATLSPLTSDHLPVTATLALPRT